MMSKAMRRRKTHKKKKIAITTIAINTTIFTIKKQELTNEQDNANTLNTQLTYSSMLA